jgi:hypothetical protein
MKAIGCGYVDVNAEENTLFTAASSDVAAPFRVVASRAAFIRSMAMLAKDNAHRNTTRGKICFRVAKIKIILSTRIMALAGSQCASVGITSKTSLEDLGIKPSADLSIERIDNNGNYEKSNCCWTTRSTQARNQRRFAEKRK